MINLLHRCPCSPTISTAMDEQLTLVEQLYKIISVLNETIEQVNKNTITLDGIELDFEDLQKQIEDLETEFNNNLNNLERELLIEINNKITVLKNYVDNNDEYLQEQITNIEIGDIEVYDPTTGILSPIQTVIDNLYNLHREDGITASEFDALELTATEFDSKEITASDFDLKAKELL